MEHVERYFAEFGDRMPQRLRDEHRKVVQRLG
jgi:hypothetical protein